MWKHSHCTAMGHADCADALTCALIAGLFVRQPAALMPPAVDLSLREGWIWVPRDALSGV